MRNGGRGKPLPYDDVLPVGAAACPARMINEPTKGKTMKRVIYPLYAAADEGRVKPILDALKEKGVTVQKANPGKRDALVLFLSENLGGEGPEESAFFRLSAGRELVIPVNLDGCTPPEELQSALMARHALDGAKYGPEELAERIAKAVGGSGGSKLPLVLSLLGVLALLVVGGLIAWNRMGKPDLRTVFAQATATPEPTATPTPAPTAVPTPTPPLPDNADITLEQLESVFELIIVGDSFNYYTGDEEWMQGSGNARVGVGHVANQGFADGQVRWYSTEDGHEFVMCDWGDLAFLPYMKNLNLLSLVNVRGTLPDLSALKQLGSVQIIDCELPDIAGLGGTGISDFSYRGSGALDLSPLNGCDMLGSLSLDLNGGTPSGLSTLSPSHLKTLYLTGGEGDMDLSGLKNCSELSFVAMNNTPLRDLSCLNVKTLSFLNLFGMDELTSLRGLEGASALQDAGFDNCIRLRDMSALSECPALGELYIQDCPLTDVSCLSGALQLRELRLENMPSLRSLHGLEEHGNLKTVKLNNLQGLTDISALGSCEALWSLYMHEVFSLRDISAVVKLPKLRDLQIYGADINNVDFLWDIPNKEYFSFGIAEVDNWEGLAAIEKYSFLNITDRNGSALPYVENATVTDFELYNRGGRGNQSEGLDITRLPHVTNELRLHCVTTLEGIDQPDVRRMLIDDCPYLTTLAGMEGIPKLSKLGIRNCPRLTEWSALYELKLEGINVEAVFTLPDFSKLTAKAIELVTIYDLEDLSCFDGFTRYGYDISLMDVDGVTDLSPLYQAHGYKLWIPAHLKEQAQIMVDSGLLDKYEVVYPEGWWQPIEPHIELQSLEEIDTLPSALLSRIKCLTLAGDTIVPDEEAWVEEDYSTYPPALYLHYDGEEERIPVEPGTLTDLSCIEKLTGLEGLTVYAQPRLVSLEGIQNMGELQRLNIHTAPALTDASAAFTVQSLEELSLRFTAITSVQGVQNLYALKRLDVNDSPVADLSPLTACPALEQVNFHLPMMTFEALKVQPAVVRENIRSLTIAGAYVYDGGPWWFEEDWVTDPPALYLHSNETHERLPLTDGPVTDMGSLAALLPNMEQLDLYGQPLATLDGMEGFEQLRRITIEECRQIADFSALWRAPSLEDINLRNEPIDSIEGIENLPHLVSLNLSGSALRDFSPLTRVDYGYCTSEECDGWGFSLALDVAASNELTYEDYAPLEAVPVYWGLNMNNVPVALWYDHVMGKEMHELSCHRSGMSNEQLQAFVKAHPMLEQLDLRWNPQLTDLSCLLALKELREVWVDQTMTQAIASLGEEYGFRLEIE